MKTLLDYMNVIKRTYHYRIKFAMTPDDEQLNKLEMILSKYNIVEIHDVFRSPLQRRPADFPNVDISEIIIIDVETEIPMSDEGLKWEISRKCKINIDHIAVMHQNGPYTPYEQQIADYQEKAYVVKMTDVDNEADTIEVNAKELYTEPTIAFPESDFDTDEAETNSSVWDRTMSKFNKIGLYK